LCTDGITRHITDNELRHLLITNQDLSALCTEFKERCYERGAEDNLTAVLVRVGAPISPDQRQEDLEQTISPETSPIPTLRNPESVQDAQRRQRLIAEAGSASADTFMAASRKAFPAPESPTPQAHDSPTESASTI
ncbi:MAG: hypothetical protein ABR501_15020, partial [Pyrinomonadaceae bacterium]